MSDAYGRCVPPYACRDCGRPRRLAQELIEEIGASGPESAERTIGRCVSEIRRLRDLTDRQRLALEDEYRAGHEQQKGLEG